MKNKKIDKFNEVFDYYNRESKKHQRIANITFALISLVIIVGFIIYLK